MAIRLEPHTFRIVYDSLIAMNLETPLSGRNLVYSLYTSHLDTRRGQGQAVFLELDREQFEKAMSASQYAAPLDIVQIYSLLVHICQNIETEYITESQRDMLKRLQVIMYNIEFRYRKMYGREIDEDCRNKYTPYLPRNPT